MDLERTIASGIPYYWKGNRHGYTPNIQFAGLFAQEFAEKIARQDFDNLTILIRQDSVSKILGKDLKQHEGIT